jgi:predicted DCC family thiol-disulfide oxidoreductase YuxK
MKRLSIPDWLRTRLVEPFGIDLRTLALFRVAVGVVLCCDLVNRLDDVRAFYTDAGTLPRDWMVQVNGLWRLTVHAANGETWFAVTMLLVELAAAVMLVLGWRARLAAFACFALHASLLNRNSLVLLGGDVLITCLLFWAMFLPVAARCSIDAALARTPPPEDNRYVSPATAGLVLQVMSVYFFSALLKTGADWWPDGTAVDYALQIDGYATPLGHWLRQYWPLTQALSYGVYFLELIGPLLVFSPILNRPLRFTVMVLLMLMHIGFILCLQIAPFPYISLSSLTVLAGGWIWDRAAAARQRRAARLGAAPLRIYYDRDCGFCLKSVLVLRQLLVLSRCEIAPAQDTPRARALLEANYSWVIIDHDDRAYLKWPAFVILLRRSAVFAPLGALLAGGWAVPIGNRVYDFVGRHRGGFGALSAKLLPFHDRSLLPGPVLSGLAGVFAVVLLAWNLGTVNWLPQRLFTLLSPPLHVLRIDQYWNMFAPFPSREDGWYVIPARRVDGREFDLFRPDRPAVSYEKPAVVSAEWKNIRWHKYFERLWEVSFASNRLYYGRWLCREWNRTHSGGEQVESFQIIYMLERSLPRGQTPVVEPVVLWRHECFDKPPAD